MSGLETSARVRIVIVMTDLGSWNSSLPAEEIFRKASETALRRIADLADNGSFQVVGEPVVELVVGRSLP